MCIIWHHWRHRLNQTLNNVLNYYGITELTCLLNDLEYHRSNFSNSWWILCVISALPSSVQNEILLSYSFTCVEVPGLIRIEVWSIPLELFGEITRILLRVHSWGVHKDSSLLVDDDLGHHAPRIVVNHNYMEKMIIDWAHGPTSMAAKLFTRF